MLELNFANKATSKHTRDFNSMCRIGTEYFGANSTGLYLIGGDDDAGANITGIIKSGEMDFGMSNKKRFRFFYFHLKTLGRLTLKIYCDNVLAASYNVAPSVRGKRTVKVPIAKQYEGGYWAWSIEGVNGIDFDLYSVQALPIILHPNRL